MAYPPMRAGLRELFWHAPVVAKPDGRFADAPRGYVTAEAPAHEPLLLEPKLLARPVHRAVATLFERDPGRARHTTAHNARKLLEMHQLLGAKLDPEHARALVHCAKSDSLEEWLAAIPGRASDRTAGGWLGTELRACVGAEHDAGLVRVIDKLGTRAFEEQIWTSIASLAHGEFKQKDNADGIRANVGKHGGKAAKAAQVVAHERRDLEALGDHLHARYRKLIEAAGMQGKAEVVDHVFRWESDFDFPWMEGWEKNQQGPKERNIVMMIPGRNRGEAIVMGDHYDTAYMEDVYDADQGGDRLRAAACGADDNHSATTALLLAAEQLLPLARAGKLERDVWLIHLTGEEFPSDCMGARAVCQGLFERSLAFTAEDGSKRDVGNVQVVGAFVLDMVGHNSDRDRDVFQIAPGEGAGSARLALRAHRANRRWNTLAETWNGDAARAKAGRAETHAGSHAAAAVRALAAVSARFVSSGSRGRRCTTPMVRSSATSGSRSCCSWRTTTSAARAITTRTTRWRTSISIMRRRSPRSRSRPSSTARAPSRSREPPRAVAVDAIVDRRCTIAARRPDHRFPRHLHASLRTRRSARACRGR